MRSFQKSLLGELVTYSTFMLLAFDVSIAGQLTKEQVYSRCYAIFVREALPEDDPILLNLKATPSMTGADACMVLFDKAQLNGQGMLIEDTDLSRKILKNFHIHHFKDFFETPDFGQYERGRTDDIYHIDEAALFLTKSLFRSGLAVDYVLKHNRELKSVRESVPAGTQNLFFLNPLDSNIPYSVADWEYGSGPTDDKDWFPEVIQMGQMKGIQDWNTDNSILPKMVKSNAQEVNYNKSIHTHLGGGGGGALGTQPYMALHYGREPGIPLDGGVKVPRRLSKMFFRSFLCRELPVVRSADNDFMIQPSSPYSFRQGGSCMRCHGSMDELTGVWRNFSPYNSGQRVGNKNDQSITVHMFDFIANQPEINDGHVYNYTPDGQFHRRPPSGYLRFRDVTGTLINKKVTSVADLGNFIANGDAQYEAHDFYRCVVKRYYSFLTGVDIPLFDPGDFSGLNDTDEKHLQNIINISNALKSNKDQRNIIKAIVELPVFSDSAYKVNE